MMRYMVEVRIDGYQSFVMDCYDSEDIDRAFSLYSKLTQAEMDEAETEEFDAILEEHGLSADGAGILYNAPRQGYYVIEHGNENKFLEVGSSQYAIVNHTYVPDIKTSFAPAGFWVGPETPNAYETRWSGEFPCLCSGHWELYRNGEKLDIDIPFNDDEGYGSDAATYGTYSTWHFGGNSGWEQIWEEYESGLFQDDWIEENRQWLESFADEKDFGSIYRAFQLNDWRKMSCGGCI